MIKSLQKRLQQWYPVNHANCIEMVNVHAVSLISHTYFCGCSEFCENTDNAMPGNVMEGDQDEMDDIYVAYDMYIFIGQIAFQTYYFCTTCVFCSINMKRLILKMFIYDTNVHTNAHINFCKDGSLINK